ncbi:hypothetical protein G5I_12216 [Acromyrmex echinatior]|uniref:Uncharacterized protein n=1 Tax=Acromyrmex echinatior TaxID=103372 RepID=F4X1P8_ACREC|nr:hypothetical protein G5I_12216 [Acromyrmex echinatior]
MGKSVVGIKSIQIIEYARPPDLLLPKVQSTERAGCEERGLPSRASKLERRGAPARPFPLLAAREPCARWAVPSAIRIFLLSLVRSSPARDEWGRIFMPPYILGMGISFRPLQKDVNKQLEIIIAEHRNHIRWNIHSVISDHRLEEDHEFDWENIAILDEEPQYRKRLVSEMLYQETDT